MIVLTVVAEKGAVAGFRVTDILAKPLDTGALLNALQRAGVTPQRRGAVLVVDDDEGSLKLMEATLERSGYDTICRKDGEAALQAAAESPLIAVVLDLIMPRLDGFEFLERFRRTESGRSTPVIVWTVKDLTKHDQARLRETAQAVVMKGNEGATALLRELDAFLPRRQSTPASAPFRPWAAPALHRGGRRPMSPSNATVSFIICRSTRSSRSMPTRITPKLIRSWC